MAPSLVAMVLAQYRIVISDGIRSFTFGAGYVPRKDLLLEAFYTFDAKGTNKRDTLYGSESFKLGDYTRIQGTYRF